MSNLEEGIVTINSNNIEFCNDHASKLLNDILLKFSPKPSSNYELMFQNEDQVTKSEVMKDQEKILLKLKVF